MGQDAYVLYTVSAKEVLLRFGLPDSWRCRSAEYDPEADTIKLRLAYPLMAVDGVQTFVEGGT